ncbi:hypothetical protein [Sabulibacter ruber]|uniref:hypothetical protein n=1 Tax=Sabulibacter ruber TaxID=2811901 RepID=UPI001A96A6F0|nr:hypothetical protein [Sabulibacter ruber]
MKNIKIPFAYLVLVLLVTVAGFGCQTAAPVGTDTSANAAADARTQNSLAPTRVDLRGTITRRVYDRGQVTIEVEGYGTDTRFSRYNRGYVLVTPVTQIVGLNGGSISLSELYEGQNVAILMRGGGRGNFVGLGVARKMWIEPRY